MDLAGLIVLGYGWFSLRYTNTPMDRYVVRQYGGHSQYLTIWCLGLTVAHFILGFILALMPLQQYPRLQRFHRQLAGICLCIAAIVTAVYWPLSKLRFRSVVVQCYCDCLFPTDLVDGHPVCIAKLIVIPRMSPFDPAASLASALNSTSTAFPDVRLFLLPLGTDLALHLAPLLFLLADAVQHRGEITLRLGKQVGLLGTIYGAWCEHCARYNHGRFAYPFLTASPWPVRIVLYATMSWIAFRVHLKLVKSLKS